jgi:hypothetical protein
MTKPSPGALSPRPANRRPANRLAQETSPYLQQHAHNPVDWYPWGPEALELAKKEGKPILLSVGYSACHWCHVMAHESFEDDTTAGLMNELFVNIKVDREERPDIDRIYQIAQQLITQKNGGWPLTMFLTHEDQRPFFGGTYFPNEARYGMPAFRDLMKRVAEYYRDHQAELREQNHGLMRAFDDLLPPAPPAGLQMSDEPLRTSRQTLSKTFDSNYGGFGGAPKFPHPKMLERLLHDWHATAASEQPDLQALYMATLTLTRMGEGGIYDQLAGGFCRYSVDSHWMIPHFEKMLYDNAGLMSVYAEAAVATGDVYYAQVVAETADWLIRDMQSPEGGFYSSLDADSEGHEGKFYVWDRDEVRQSLSDEEYALFAPRYGLDRSPISKANGICTFQKRRAGGRAGDVEVPTRCMRSRLRNRCSTSVNRVSGRARRRFSRHGTRSRFAAWPWRPACWPATIWRSPPRARSTSFATRSGAMAGCWRHAKTAALISTPISTTTSISPMRCWSCSRFAFARTSWRSRASCSTPRSHTSKTRPAAGSSSPPTTTKRSSTAPGRSATMPFRRATAWPRSCSSAWGTCSARTVTCRRPSAPCAPHGCRSRNTRAGIAPCSACSKKR